MTPTSGVASSRDAGRAAMSEVLQSLLRASHLLAPDDLAAVVAAHARMLGAEETVLYLADYEQATLLPLPGAGVPERQELPIEGTMAGRAFRRVELLGSPGENGYQLWAPLLDGVERLGVAELVLPEEPRAAPIRRGRSVAKRARADWPATRPGKVRPARRTGCRG
jgi:hypothetical protein